MFDENDGLSFNFAHKHPWRRALSRELSRALRKPVCKDMRRLEREWPEFAEATLDFILDVVDAPSLWSGYESWNLRHFGAALPITGGDPGVGLTAARLRHFLWKMLNIVAGDFSLPPDHPDVQAVIDTVGTFWEKRKSAFSPLGDSSAFLAGPIRHGAEVKDRLVALGQAAYFFRAAFAEYIPDEGGYETFIAACDDFLCQSCSQWSGMGPIDLLAETLAVPEALREDIRSWSERHAAPFRVDLLGTDHMLVTNLVINEQYRVTRDEGAEPIPAGMVAFGFLARWNGGWRWSGVQKILGEYESVRDGMERIVHDMRLTSNRILCRYWPEYKQQALDALAAMQKSEREFHGDRDLVYFENGRMLAAAAARFLNEYRDTRVRAMKTPPEDIPEDFTPETVLSGEIRDCDDGVGLFLNPEEGSEMMLSFDLLASGLRKSGDGVTPSEHAALRGFIESESISPAFVRRVLREEPDRSLKVAFGVGDDAPGYWLDWLLRCWKGEFYRPRYPSVSVV